MKNIRDFGIFLSLCVFALAFSACSKDRSNVPTGRVVSEEYSFSGSLSKIEVSDGIRLVITSKIPEKTVSVVTNEEIQQYVIVQQRQGALRVYVDEEAKTYSQLEIAVYVSTNNFDTFSVESGAIMSSIGVIEAGNVELNIDGAAHVDADFKCNSMILGMTGASVLNSDISASDFYAGISGASKAELSGNADYFELIASGASNLSAFGLVCNTFDFAISGGTAVEITVTGLMNGEISGGSSLLYKGNPPRIIIDKTGASQVESAD